jgi:hypothetical protein
VPESSYQGTAASGCVSLEKFLAFDALKTAHANLKTVLDFGTENLAHGTAEMPVSGPVYGKMDLNLSQQNLRQLRVSNLSSYIESFQVK